MATEMPGRIQPSRDFLFIVTYGRSGSTLLQGVLNSIPGYLIRGENEQVLRHFYEAHRTLSVQRKKQRRWLERNSDAQNLPPTHAFFGIDDFPNRKSHRIVRRYAVETLLRPGPDTRVTGFKEIRWADEDLPQFIGWMTNVFPGARFIINTRNLHDVARSAWWKGRSDARKHLKKVEQRILQVGEELGDAAYHVHYDDYAGQPAALAGLFEWLGEPFDQERVESVMNVRHSWPYTKE